jgi:membrane protease YdiL (CAAX protease family)
MAGLAYGVAVGLDVAQLRNWDPQHGLLWWSLNVVSTLAFMTVIFLGEEIGWRGYMLPRVQQLTSRRRAALITGFVHGCFHLPLILIATTYDEFGARWFVAPMVVAVLTMGGVFYAYLWDRTHSVWPVSMAHGSINIAFGWGAAAVVGSQTDLAYVAGESGAATLLVVGLVGVAFLARAKVWRVPAVDSAVAEDRGTVSV